MVIIIVKMLVILVAIMVVIITVVMMVMMAVVMVVMIVIMVVMMVGMAVVIEKRIYLRARWFHTTRNDHPQTIEKETETAPGLNSIYCFFQATWKLFFGIMYRETFRQVDKISAGQPMISYTHVCIAH